MSTSIPDTLATEEYNNNNNNNNLVVCFLLRPRAEFVIVLWVKFAHK
jgi:hypothetical protein